MSNAFTRRSMLQLLGVAAPAAALALSAPAESAAAVVGPVRSARPGVIRSYGPNGTHWPSHTPWIGDTVPYIVEVACTWSSIALALARVTSAEAAAGVIIKVQPGTLPGFGASSGSNAVLQDVGRANWAQNVLVAPRDGWGTVSIGGPARLLNVAGVTFARINGTDILLTNCNRTAWAHSKVTVGLKMTSSYTSATSGCSAYEVVMPVSRASDAGDPMGYGTGDWCIMTDSIWEGCYVAPVFRPLLSQDHIDTIQMYGGGWYRGLTLRDSTFFGSLNCAVQIGGARPFDPNRGTPFLTLDRSVITSQATAIQVRYPVPPGASRPSLAQAINGTGDPGQLFSNDSLIFGSMHHSSWGTVTNTRVSYARAVIDNRVRSGSWTVDPSMNSWGAAEFDSLTPVPTDAYLAAIWR